MTYIRASMVPVCDGSPDICFSFNSDGCGIASQKQSTTHFLIQLRCVYYDQLYTSEVNILV